MTTIMIFLILFFFLVNPLYYFAPKYLGISAQQDDKILFLSVLLSFLFTALITQYRSDRKKDREKRETEKSERVYQTALQRKKDELDLLERKVNILKSR